MSQIRLRMSLMTASYHYGSSPPGQMSHSADWGGLRGRAHLDGGEQTRRGGGDLVDGRLERGGVPRGGSAESADLPDILQRGCTDVSVGHLFGVRRAQGLDTAAHTSHPMQYFRRSPLGAWRGCARLALNQGPVAARCLR